MMLPVGAINNNNYGNNHNTAPVPSIFDVGIFSLVKPTVKNNVTNNRSNLYILYRS